MLKTLLFIAGVVLLIILVNFTVMEHTTSDTVGKVMKDKYTNKLIDESSPYLLQHAHNPVNWYPWGEEAFAKARREDKPILLSIGYSTCHWCHVMEEEVFSDPEAAAVINRIFVPIKVDREERPDIDQVYMTVSQIMTGSGGWPLNVFMTADKEPFYVATYIPKQSSFGRPGVMQLLPRIEEVWKNDRKGISESVQSIIKALHSVNDGAPAESGQVSPAIFEDTFTQLSQLFDGEHGGFGKDQKFPRPHNMRYLLRHWKRTGDANALKMVEETLQAMRKGGIYDQVGFGFHRYATDEAWKLPHFEKMLYDQALIAMAYIETYAATGKQVYADTAREIFTYVLRDMTSPKGLFYSAEDADSEGEEGLFYLWTVDELEHALGKKGAALIGQVFNVENSGNFLDEASGKKSGRNIFYRDTDWDGLAKKAGLNRDELEKQIESARQRLFKLREERVHPFKDEKVLVDWNGLMIAALAMGGRILNEPAYTEAAEKAAKLILDKMRQKDGRLLHRWNSGDAGIAATLDDYAFFVWGLIELYQAGFDSSVLNASIELNSIMMKEFEDPDKGGFFLTARDAENLLIRPKEIYDGAIPSGNSVALLNMLRLARLTGDSSLEKAAQSTADAFYSVIEKGPFGYTQFISSLDFALSEGYEIVIVGDPDAKDTKAMLKSLNHQFQPNAVVILRTQKKDGDAITRLAPYTRFHTSIDGKATAYVCQNFSCNQPTTDIKKMLKLLNPDS
ncbi:MAG: thioredoxin domain-containing protein [Mariprofundaceae bacterium]